MVRSVIVAALTFASAAAWAGPTKHIGKELTKGVGEEVENKVQGLDLEKSARQLGAGLVEGVHSHDKEASASARAVGRAMAEGFAGGLRNELADAFPCEGKDRAACVDAWLGRLSYATSHAAALATADAATPWPSVLMFIGGVVSGLVAATLVALLLGQRRIRREQMALRPRTA
jgi:hypothetical protein